MPNPANHKRIRLGSSFIYSRASARALIDESFREPSTLVESRVLHGDPANKICECADISHADLIIVGSRGTGRLKRLLGSVSEGVSRNARCSVMMVR